VAIHVEMNTVKVSEIKRARHFIRLSLQGLAVTMGVDDINGVDQPVLIPFPLFFVAQVS